MTNAIMNMYQNKKQILTFMTNNFIVVKFSC